MAHGKKVKNIIQKKNNIKNYTKPRDKEIYINFSQYDKWAYSFEYKDFTNSLKDEKELANNLFFLLDKLFPNIEKNYKNIIAGTERHCHIVTGATRKKIVNLLEKFSDCNIDEDTNIWQFGLIKDFRLFATIVSNKDGINILYPLLLDHHHMICPSIKYNQIDKKKYKLKAQDIYKLK